MRLEGLCVVLRLVGEGGPVYWNHCLAVCVCECVIVCVSVHVRMCVCVCVCV